MKTPKINVEINHKLREMVALERFRESRKEDFSVLTVREKEVIRLVAKGLSNCETAAILSISRLTVQNHRANIRRKLDIKSDIDYLKFALAYDLIQF